LQPSAETERLYQELQALDAEATSLPADESTGTMTKTRLPVSATPFIGRRRELAELQQLLGEETESRLVSIIGPGGIGKTRLALETARAVEHDLPDGVFFVPLAPLTDAGQIVAAISDGIGYRYSAGGDPRQGLLNYLGSKQLLLVLDNFEHVLAGVEIVTDILHQTSQVHILCTSRERLNLSSEAIYLLSGLEYPADASLPGEEATQFGAVQLLLGRARLVRPDLQVDELMLVQVSRICRLVQGMPLALVLAAGWLELLTFEEVADEIAASLDILESQVRDMPERQRSVRAAFNYSWQRLDPEDQQAFSRLAIFRGGFSRRAAEQIASAGLRALRTLVEKSLITAEGPDRYAVHELLRQFAEEKLEATGQAEPIRDAHSQYYLAAVAEREAELKGRRQLEALEEIEVDLDNVRAAWGWALEQQDEQAIDEAQEGISLFFYIRTWNQEGWFLFRQALLGLAVDQTWSNYSKRFWGRLAARAMLLQAQFAESAPEIENTIKQSLDIAETNGDVAEIAYSYLALGHYHSRVTGDFSQALDYFLQSLEWYQELGDDYYVAHILHRVGYSYGFVTGGEDYIHFTSRSLDLARQIGDFSDAANALGNLGWSSLDTADYVAAESYARESITLSRQLRNFLGVAHSLILLGLCHVLFGRLQEAQKAATDGIVIAKDLVFTNTRAYGLAITSVKASLQGDYELGRQLAEESLELHANPSGDFLGHWAQAMAFVGVGETEQAKHHSLAALEICARWEWETRMTWLLPGVGIILAQQGHSERAVESLALFFNHPYSITKWAENWPLLSTLKTRLGESLEPEPYRAAWERGRELDLVATIGGYLDLEE
jgi:predicted ATPase